MLGVASDLHTQSLDIFGGVTMHPARGSASHLRDVDVRANAERDSYREVAIPVD
jgi:hypothetical protein